MFWSTLGGPRTVNKNRFFASSQGNPESAGVASVMGSMTGRGFLAPTHPLHLLLSPRSVATIRILAPVVKFSKAEV
ncbi:hypothetical protein TNIN_436411 [Trichonephila inaurata madagascariensis]|uniref:Uncharacterized protein n=1 Tax=Trichonephila inaurata madagascariensis TaxID=2747483 RepID=A0A8X6Y7N7_9ARAC|nr:hypothetical protein TNIN_436411 [Trichonephila inaurata madagascariensis]